MKCFEKFLSAMTYFPRERIIFIDENYWLQKVSFSGEIDFSSPKTSFSDGSKFVAENWI